MVCKCHTNLLCRGSMRYINVLHFFATFSAKPHPLKKKTSTVHLIHLGKFERSSAHSLFFRGRLRVRDTSLTNRCNVCIQHFTSISCKHRNNFDWFHSGSIESLIGFGETEYDINISLISRVMSLILGLPPKILYSKALILLEW